MAPARHIYWAHGILDHIRQATRLSTLVSRSIKTTTSITLKFDKNYFPLPSSKFLAQTSGILTQLISFRVLAYTLVYTSASS